LRLAFFGSSQFSGLIFRALLDSQHTVACVVTQPDQPAGRRMVLTPTSVAVDAEAAGIPVLKPERLKGNAVFLADLADNTPEALLVASYGKILPRSVLEATPWPLNVHPSDLPHLRGASPIRTALLQGLHSTACCIMRMTPRLDDGDVVLRAPLDIPVDWNYARLEEELGTLGGQLAIAALNAAEAGTAMLEPQDHARATYCGTYSREDTWIDWTRSARELRDFVRAWDPDLGALTTLPDGRRLKVWRAEAVDGEGAPAVVLRADRSGLDVGTGDRALRLLEVQPENKRRMGIGDFLAGHRLEVGAQFPR
jgi:methionyl-tRNA formyltransferase